ncbi:hypothetical protein [Paraburkholderia kururiensis]|uniref:hypothetical protein n=1 Tax=Paraburkholderia kururiensis TaxID=984307 RepID=UPI001F286FBE|nr:hypothetical protein [Paraburkholderia kururiensis]
MGARLYRGQCVVRNTAGMLRQVRQNIGKTIRGAGMRFRRRDGVVVEASRWFFPEKHPRVQSRGGKWMIATPDGWREVKAGDWILTDSTGNSWPMSNLSFCQVYEPMREPMCEPMCEPKRDPEV